MNATEVEAIQRRHASASVRRVSNRTFEDMVNCGNYAVIERPAVVHQSDGRFKIAVQAAVIRDKNGQTSILVSAPGTGNRSKRY